MIYLFKRTFIKNTKEPLSDNKINILQAKFFPSLHKRTSFNFVITIHTDNRTHELLLYVRGGTDLFTANSSTRKIHRKTEFESKHQTRLRISSKTTRVLRASIKTREEYKSSNK